MQNEQMNALSITLYTHTVEPDLTTSLLWPLPVVLSPFYIQRYTYILRPPVYSDTVASQRLLFP